MNITIHVGNLSANTSSFDLESLFEDFGSVQSAHVVANDSTGRSKGYGFVEMKTDEQAVSAIAALNGMEFDGRNIAVTSVARAKSSRQGR